MIICIIFVNFKLWKYSTVVESEIADYVNVSIYVFSISMMKYILVCFFNIPYYLGKFIKLLKSGVFTTRYFIGPVFMSAK